MSDSIYPDDTAILSHIPPTLRQHISALQSFKTLDSTNTYVIDALKKGAPSGVVCIAQHQSQGRGHFDRAWLSSPNGSLCLSLAWDIVSAQQIQQRKTETLSTQIGISVIKALQAYGIQGDQLSLKHPNDILWQDKKLAGILIETTSSIDCWVIGIGLNFVLPETLKHQINQPCVDIETIMQEYPDRNRLAGLVLGYVLGGLAGV
jgi:BirA family biotin operon repressor/biotin-[acetyl-CoA-carboxylase] ligase